MAATSKLVASLLTYPHEVVRTRMRELVNGKCPYNGLYDAFTRIAKEEGRSGLYRGMGVHLSRTVPNTAIMFFVYEYVVNLWRSQNQ
jgi:solute carrier family 25, member 33/36